MEFNHIRKPKGGNKKRAFVLLLLLVFISVLWLNIDKIIELLF